MQSRQKHSEIFSKVNDYEHGESAKIRCYI